MVGTSPRRANGAALAALRDASAADHESVDTLVDQDRMVDIEYYVAVVRGLIAAAEVVEVALPGIPLGMHREGLSPSEVSKRLAIDAESSFLNDLVGSEPLGCPTTGDQRPFWPDPLERGMILGLLYVYVGSALGGLHLLRVARNAPWWKEEREHTLLQPYGRHFGHRWRAVLNALARLDACETDSAVMGARVGFDLHRRSLVAGLSVGGCR